MMAKAHQDCEKCGWPSRLRLPAPTLLSYFYYESLRMRVAQGRLRLLRAEAIDRATAHLQQRPQRLGVSPLLRLDHARETIVDGTTADRLRRGVVARGLGNLGV